MPALPSPGKVIKTAIQMAIGDKIVENIKYWGYSSANPTVSILGELGALIWTQYKNNVLFNMSNQVSLSAIQLEDLSSATGATAEYVGSAAVGPDTDEILPTNVALVISQEIARRYRGGHSRIYLPGYTTRYFVVPNQWDSTIVTDAAEGFGVFTFNVVNGSISGLTQTGDVNVSYYTDHALRVTPVVDPITSYVARVRVCSQRRRLGKIGG